MTVQVIALEEHYLDEEIVQDWGAAADRLPPAILGRLADLSDDRLRDMDRAGIDIEVLSLNAPSTQIFDASRAPAIARRANDRLHQIVMRRPDRFAAFAALPTADPQAAARELERTVRELGFKGGLISGLSHGHKFVDLPEFWPIYAAAEQLGVPIYLHPSIPHPALVGAYLADYAERYPQIARAAWAFTVETATQAVRMVLSGVLDRHPRLRLILGHLGEGLPFLLWRIDRMLVRPNGPQVEFREQFRRHFHITTSANFSDAALLCSMMEMGADRILFSVDYPYAANSAAREWADRLPLSSEDREKLLGRNAQKLLNINL